MRCWISSTRCAVTEGACFAAPWAEQGLFWLFETTVKDGTGAIAGQKLVGIRQNHNGQCAPLDPLALLDVDPFLVDPDNPPPAPTLPDPLPALAVDPETVEAWCKTEIRDPYLEQLRQKRLHEANVREDYVQRSLDTLIADQTSRIIAYASNEQVRARDPNKYDIGLRTLEQNLEEYQTRLQRRLEENTHMRSLGADPPRMVGVCVLVPAPDVLAGEDTGEDAPDTEAVAVEVAMRYERDHGRSPYSVEADGLGFDVRSHGANELRYIEVKGRKGTGAVMLTANEWIKAARFGNEYWLYVVYDCATPDPRLVIIRDPAACLTVAENSFSAARYRVNVGEVQKHGIPADVGVNEGE